jgi:hypothetical protein
MEFITEGKRMEGVVAHTAVSENLIQEAAML